MLQSNTPQDVQSARDAVTQAEQALALAKSPYTPEQIQQAQAGVTQALAQAQEMDLPREVTRVIGRVSPECFQPMADVISE